MTSGLPWRGPGPGRPTDIPLPPAQMPALRHGRMLKRWRYVGVFGPDLSLCAAAVRIGLFTQHFWAIWDREHGVLHERTRLLRRPVRHTPGRVAVRDGGIAFDLTLDEGEGIEVVTPYGRGHAWTRKQGGIEARGTLTIAGRTRTLEACAVVDDTAAYYPRHTGWVWSAGVGAADDGRAVAWNVVSGVHDSPEHSERTVWVDGVPREVGPVGFAGDLSSIRFADGGLLECEAEAVRARRENLVLIRSDYVQPFGAFRGSLPGGIALAEGFGVMERHSAVW